MTELPPTESLPAPSASAAAPRRGWFAIGAALMAAAVGVVGAALVSDNASADGEERVEPTATARPVPVLATGPVGSALSQAVSQYAITAFSDQTRGLVLSGWGAAFSELFGSGGEGAPAPEPGAVLLDDPRLTDPAGGPAFVDPCAGAGPDAELPDACPDGDAVPAEVLGDEPLGPNAVTLYAFPNPDADLADECDFADLRDGEVPVAVISANPGEIELRRDDEVVTVESDDAEIAEFEAWRDAAEGVRPPGSFVAHCIALPEPASTGPVHLTAVAVDEAGQVAVAETILVPALEGLPPASITPLDDTLVRVDVPLPADGADATVRTAPVPAFAGALPSCAALPDAAPSGWRLGTSSLGGDPGIPGERPYLEDAPRIRRVTVPLPEGEPSVLCIGVAVGDASTTTVLITPPDARRLRLAVTEVDADEAIEAGDLKVRGTFAELGWVPCGAVLPAAPAGTSEPGAGGVLCASGGDTGAIAAAGGVLDLSIQSGSEPVHRVRVALSASPGGPASEAYRLPIPAPDLDGVLCTAGVVQPGCIEPEGDAVLGTLVVTATWDEGPTGPADWVVTTVPA